MVTLTGDTIYLRALEPEDLEFIYAIENHEPVWEVSNTQTPYSRYLIRHYLKNAHRDIYDVKQLRLAICKKENNSIIGLIDLFDFDAANQRAGVGIVVKDDAERGKGVGKEALGLLIAYAFTHLRLHQLYANIGTDNAVSIRLFTNFGFAEIGIKRDWNRTKAGYADEAIYQLINTN